MTERTWLTKKEVAAYLRVSERTVERMMEKRKIPYYRVSVNPQFDKQQIDNWLEKRAVKTSA
jgi:excisionase family DNA binding protein